MEIIKPSLSRLFSAERKVNETRLACGKQVVKLKEKIEENLYNQILSYIGMVRAL